MTEKKEVKGNELKTVKEIRFKLKKKEEVKEKRCDRNE